MILVRLALPLALLGAACTTETSAGAAVVDASAPASDAADVHATDAGAVVDASAPASDAGSSAPDAGQASVADAGTVGTTSTGEAPVRPTLGKSTPFDRVLVKPKAQSGDVEALKALIEKKTGHKLALVRRTAGKWLLLQFAPTSKGRDADDQAKLVDVLKGMDDFASVEGDRLMKVKQP